MRIDGTNRLNPNGLQEGTYGKNKLPKPTNTPSSVSSDAQVVVSHGRYVQAVKDVDSIDTNAVEKAKTLLESGALDTPDAAMRAAQAMISGGA